MLLALQEVASVKVCHDVTGNSPTVLSTAMHGLYSLESDTN